ncbi:hypothetical protein [Noviherbaspirillum cavernae]
MKWSLIAAVALLCLSSSAMAQAKKKNQPAAAQNEMTFFITSTGTGKGANLGGLPGADQHCHALAKAANLKYRTWRAYLSTTALAGASAVNARDRIGSGPWHNAKGVLIARDIDELHASNNISKDTALTEKSEIVNGRGDTPNRHDILTGSQPDGRALRSDQDTTCGNWTRSESGSAIVGHHDRKGLSDDDAARSWNSSHPSKGCSQEALRSTGGDGLLYCFAIR